MGFQYRRLLVYGKIVEYRRLAQPFLQKLLVRDPKLHDQLRRNGQSMSANTAEGASEDRPGTKANYYRIAKREAEEAASNWESAVDGRYFSDVEIRPLLDALDEIARMHAGLISRFGTRGTPTRGRKPDTNDGPNPHS